MLGCLDAYGRGRVLVPIIQPTALACALSSTQYPSVPKDLDFFLGYGKVHHVEERFRSQEHPGIHPLA
jgi:hypothetical protein